MQKDLSFIEKEIALVESRHPDKFKEKGVSLSEFIDVFRVYDKPKVPMPPGTLGDIAYTIAYIDGLDKAIQEELENEIDKRGFM